MKMEDNMNEIMKITRHTAIIVKKARNKTEYNLSDNSYTLFNHAKPHVIFIIMFMFCLLDRTIQICVSFDYLVLLSKIILSIWFFWVKFSHTGHWMFNMAPHDKELSEGLIIWIVALHKDGLGYEKFGNSLELSCSAVAGVIQRFSKTAFTRNRPRKGRSKKLSH